MVTQWHRKSAYLSEYEKQLQSGGKCTKSKMTALTDSHIRTEPRRADAKRKPNTWKVLSPSTFLGRGLETAMMRMSLHPR